MEELRDHPDPKENTERKANTVMLENRGFKEYSARPEQMGSKVFKA